MAEEIIRFETTHYDEKTESATLSCKTITRAEAIEKMAKALYEHQYQKMRPLWEDEDNGYVEIYLKRAEAALNALLGE